MIPSYLNHRIRHAADVLRTGGVIAYPTEAVYGLGCDPWDRAAVERILEIKARAPSKGLILIAADFAQLRALVEPLDDAAMAPILASWPGPNTWILPRTRHAPDWLGGRFDTLAVRVTAHPVAAALCRTYGGAIVSTSANVSARPPARSAFGVHLALGQGPDYVLSAPCGGAERPSTIRDGRTGRVLRA